MKKRIGFADREAGEEMVGVRPPLEPSIPMPHSLPPSKPQGVGWGLSSSQE